MLARALGGVPLYSGELRLHLPVPIDDGPGLIGPRLEAVQADL